MIMYQLLFATNDNSGRKFAANVPEKDVTFLTNYFNIYGGFTRYLVDIYDCKVSAKEYGDYGYFESKKSLLAWLFGNVFVEINTLITLEKFIDAYEKQRAEYIEHIRINDIIEDILYDEYQTGANTHDTMKRLNGEIFGYLWNHNIKLPTKAQVQRAIRKAFVTYVLAH